ncbi:hypothetical protein L914_18597, partial [Phytophthora nicotianae]
VWKHLPVEVLYDEAPPAKRSTSVSITTIERPDKPSNAAPAATPPPPHSVDNATTKASATPPVNSPAQSPAKPPGKTPAKSPAKSPAKTRGRPPGKPPTPKQKRVGNHTAATSVVHVDKRVPLPRSARLAAEAVDISAGNDRMSSGDEDDYGLDDDDESDAEYIIDDAED